MVHRMVFIFCAHIGKLYDPKSGKLYDPKNENLYGYNHWVAEQVFARITFTTGLTNGYNHWISDGAKPATSMAQRALGLGGVQAAIFFTK